jgi:5-methylcytosine-specific restriction endonuclease McrA
VTLLRSAPMRPRSDKGRVRDRQLARTKLAILARSGYRCELCGKRDVRLDLHHVCGRSGMGRWNHSPWLCAAVCRPEHRSVNNPQAPADFVLVRRLRTAAAQRIVSHTGYQSADWDDPLALIRRVVEWADQQGIEP